MAKNGIKYANLDTSKRLQRLMNYLSDLKEHSTRDIIRGAKICSVNTAICELRKNVEFFGLCITCKRVSRHVWVYQMGRMA
jgi:hypothetical protein